MQTWANIAIDSVPAGATILLDGEPAGTTPATLEILQGEHQLSLTLERFSTWQDELVVVPGEHQVLETVELQPAEAQLVLSSRPSRASVTLDGEFQGQTPVTLELKPDTSHRLAVFKPGYSSVNRIVSLGAAEQQVVSRPDGFTIGGQHDTVTVTTDRQRHAGEALIEVVRVATKLRESECLAGVEVLADRLADARSTRCQRHAVRNNDERPHFEDRLNGNALRQNYCTHSQRREVRDCTCN